MPAVDPDICLRTADGVVFRYRVAALIVRDRRVLLAGNAKNAYLYSVGGGVQLFETAEQALRRELLEEPGWTLEPGPRVVIHENFFVEDAGERWHELAFYYRVDVSDDFEPRGSSVTMDGVPERLRWVDLDDLPGLRAYPTWLADVVPHSDNATPDQGVRHIVTIEDAAGTAASGSAS
ncbi:MAG: NUDIX domain-containing protein [Propionicimonas sp.]|nr:NUDIX domain-containing protein [Propionicimonas sp.]